MASYAEKQLFKTRFWKHIWNLDPESLRELLDEGNPIGHVNFPFRVPSDHGYVFHTAYKGEIYNVTEFETIYTGIPRRVTKTKDKSASEFRNEAIENYFNSYGATACDILWKMLLCTDCDTLCLPNGVSIDDDYEIREMLSMLAENNPKMMYKAFKPIKWSDPLPVDVPDIFALRLVFSDFKPEEIFQSGLIDRNGRKVGLKPEYYKLVLLYYPGQFNRFVQQYHQRYRYLRVFSDLFEWCKASDDVTKKLWKLRLVNIDPERWVPTYDDRDVSVEGLDDVSVEELKAMYEGHPKNINPHDIDLELSDRPAKKAKSDTN